MKLNVKNHPRVAFTFYLMGSIMLFYGIFMGANTLGVIAQETKCLQFEGYELEELEFGTYKIEEVNLYNTCMDFIKKTTNYKLYQWNKKQMERIK